MPIVNRDDIWTPNNRPKFLCLFQEFKQTADEKPIFTLRDEKEGLISLKRLFIKLTIDDPTEATFADEVFGDIYWWMEVRDHKMLKPHIDKWREEAELIRKSIAFKALYKEVAEDGRAALTAAKYLIEEPWKTKGRKAAGKQTTERAAEAVKNHYKDDYARLKEEGILQ